MAIIDSTSGSLVIRIVYDGPPLSGKTTTLRALASVLRTAAAETPAEAEGRTLFFDWVQFHGGYFGGKKICCQIVSVPGQAELRHRREFLLRAADAIVFVADTREGNFAPSSTLLQDLVVRARAEYPPVGLVFQANKRDAPDAMDREVLCKLLESLCPMPLIDTIAVGGAGVREAFVLAVRLAMDRVRALMQQGKLASGIPTEASADELLVRMQGLEHATADQGARSDQGGTPSELREYDLFAPEMGATLVDWVPGDERLFRADEPLPTGHIWPPVDGRALVYEASRSAIRPVRTADGAWWASTGNWRFHSASGAIYLDSLGARRALVDWARVHSLHPTLLSPSRALLLADAGKSRQRIWQLVRVESSLHERLLQQVMNPQLMAKELCNVAEHLIRARERIAASHLQVRCTLWTIHEDVSGEPKFVGFLPSLRSQVANEAHGETLIARELLPHLLALKPQGNYEGVLEQLVAERHRDWSSFLVRLARECPR